MAHKIVVIGAANADIAGIPSNKLIQRDSNPGKISFSPGGVGRNIACSLRQLGEEVSFITALGNDMFGEFIKKDCIARGIDTKMTLVSEEKGSSTYLYICDETGDMALAVNDMDIVEDITPAYLEKYIEEINRNDACVIDANLSTDTIEYISENVTVPIYADPVSTVKAVRLKGVINGFEAVKPNRMEYKVLGRAECKMFVSLGEDGMLAIQGDERTSVDAPKMEAFSANGAGDAATAAVVYADLQGYSLEETARFAVEFASSDRKRERFV